MTYDLRIERWLPCRRRSGKIEWLAPHAIWETDDPVVALATPRPDFNGAVLEKLIGLKSVALALPDEDAWIELGETPPSPEYVHERLLALPEAFTLDGDGPRFLQDFTAADFATRDDLPIETLLIDTAGEDTDLFVKRGRADVLGRPAAAMALITLQTYAPSGGQGHRTSMRGGGPLTTLAEPRSNNGHGQDESFDQPLWKLIHANLMLADSDAPLPADWQSAEGRHVAPLIWPWLAPTITSERIVSNGQSQERPPVTPQDAHPFQALFGMPRRIRLIFDDTAGCCALTGERDTCMVPAWRMINLGINYGSGQWLHPLSPYYRKQNEWLPCHPQPDGLGWKDWAGLVLDQNVGKSEQRVAQTVRRFRSMHQPFAVRAFGYDMANMKARGWAEAILPAWVLTEDSVIKALTDAASQMAEATRHVANLLVGAVIAARFRRKEDAKGDFSFIKAELWSATQEPFYARIDAAAHASIDHAHSIIANMVEDKSFIDMLRIKACHVFDRHAERIGLDVADERRFVDARRNLVSALRGYGKAGDALFRALGLPSPEKKSKKTKEKKA